MGFPSILMKIQAWTHTTPLIFGKLSRKVPGTSASAVMGMGIEGVRFVRLLLACKAEGGNDVWGALKRMWLSCQMGNIGELPPKFACISPLLFSSGTTRSCYISKCCSYDQYSQYIM
ncbi:hypothetical protein Y032_0010g959 [Ancylostoma ceylanicum]|uniref:Uncharacterized protein n=1 Tax=Ancylostoma ceylanicum TaxID=53326 RepID=A0A016VIC7_9BILA|nr:hypothetical protein Y032_0010g959 [Ancylostoma ceylanicum]